MDPETERLIVNISLLAIDAEHATAKVAYRVVPWQRRHGYAGEALQAVTVWAFRELLVVTEQVPAAGRSGL